MECSHNHNIQTQQDFLYEEFRYVNNKTNCCHFRDHFVFTKTMLLTYINE